MSDTDSTADGEAKQKLPAQKRTFTPPKRQPPPGTTTEEPSSEKRGKSFGEWLDSEDEGDFD